jgi:hypothetical protein
MYDSGIRDYGIFQGWYYTIQLKRLRNTMESLNQDNLVNMYVPCYCHTNLLGVSSASMQT